MRSKKRSAYPVIGLTMDFEPPAGPEAFNHGRPFYYVNQDYVRMVQEVGGVVVALPPEEVAGRREGLLQELDGLLLVGGSDIDPRSYGEEPLNPGWRVDSERTAFERELIRAAVDKGVPVLGICRGCQMLNVAFGGTLFQDLPTQRPSEVRHRAKGGDPPARHPIRIGKGTKLFEILGQTELEVNSYHHQGIRDLGHDLVASAWSPDGLVEAVELKSADFCLGVQWHPERDFDREEQRLLLSAFMKAARAYTPRKV